VVFLALAVEARTSGSRPCHRESEMRCDEICVGKWENVWMRWVKT
jgi:hypothetical protein